MKKVALENGCSRVSKVVMDIGEVPFFTAFNEVGGAKIFLDELLTVGVPMSLALTVFWAAWVWVSERRRSALRA